MEDQDGGRRRLFDSGELRLVLLKLISDQPRHGYDLIRAIEELTGGAYAPSPGVVYPALSVLQDLGHIEGAEAESSRKAFSITIPYLKPLVIINFVGAFIGAFRSWEGIFVMCGSGPNDGTHVLGMEVWFNAFAYLRFGYATAVAWIIGAALVGFTVYQLRILKNVKFTTAKRD